MTNTPRLPSKVIRELTVHQERLEVEKQRCRELSEELGHSLRVAATKRNLTLAKLARLSKIPLPRLVNWLYGNVMIEPRIADQLLKTINTTKYHELRLRSKFSRVHR